MNSLQIYRKRFIPQETILLKDDLVLFQASDKIITSWNILKPRKDIFRGISGYFLDKGYKISKIYNRDDQLVYWYCDIIRTEWDHNTNSLTAVDLLVDILIYPDHSIRVLDLNELQDAYNQHIISEQDLEYALIITQNLLCDLRNGNFNKYMEIINSFELKKRQSFDI